MGLVIKRTGAEEYGRTAKVLIAGAPGAGKTRISSTFPFPFYANIEGGLMSVADRAVPYVDVTSSDEMSSLLMALRQPPKMREQILGSPVSTVIIDTLDAYQKLLIDERKRAEKKDAMAIQDWGWLGDQLRLTVRSFRNLDLNVIFTCHVKTSEDGESGATFVTPALQGAMGDEIAAYVDVAGLLKASPVNTVKEGKAVRVLQRLLQTSPDARHPWLKDRSGKLPMEYDVNLVSDGTSILKLIFAVAPLQPSEQIAAPEISPAAPVAPAVASPPAAGAPPEAPVKRGPGRPPGSPNKPKPPLPPVPAEEVSRAAERPAETPAPTEPLVEQPVSANGSNGSQQALPESAAEPVVVQESPVLAVVPDVIPSTVDEMICSECGEMIESEDFKDLSLVRFRQPLCRKDYQARKAARK